MSAVLLLSGCSTGTPDEAPTPTPSSVTSVPAQADDAPEPADSPLITNLRLCGAETYDSQANACPETATNFTSGTVHCTADVEVGQAERFTVRFYRNGLLAHENGVTFPDNVKDSTTPVYGTVNVGELDAPGGNWLCEIALSGGERETGETSVVGPAGRFSQAMACDSSSIYERGLVKHCRSNAETLPSTTRRISCSSVLAYAPGVDVTMQAEWDTNSSSGTRTLGTASSPVGMATFHASFNAFSLTGDPQLAPGDYRCRYFVDGVEVGSHPFTVA